MVLTGKAGRQLVVGTPGCGPGRENVTLGLTVAAPMHIVHIHRKEWREALMETLWLRSPCYFFRLHTAARKLGRVYDEALAPYGIRVTQYSLLSHLRRLGPISKVELGKAMALDRSTLVRNITPLERMGLVEAQTDVPAASKNRRYGLSAKGLQLQAQAHAAWAEVHKRVEAALTGEEAQALESVLGKVGAMPDGRG